MEVGNYGGGFVLLRVLHRLHQQKLTASSLRYRTARNGRQTSQFPRVKSHFCYSLSSQQFEHVQSERVTFTETER